MKKFGKIMLVITVLCVGTTAFAGPRGHHREKNDGLRLANGIVNLVLRAVNPQPVHIKPRHHHRRPAPPPPPRKPHRPAPRRHR